MLGGGGGLSISSSSRCSAACKLIVVGTWRTAFGGGGGLGMPLIGEGMVGGVGGDAFFWRMVVDVGLVRRRLQNVGGR